MRKKYVYGAPPRIQKLHAALINSIPRVPNDRAALEHMQRKSLGDLLIAYVNWRARYVSARPRTVSIELAALDARRNANAAAIDDFLEKVRRGADLTPHLSLKPLTRGYAVAAGQQGLSTSDRKWLDKDFLLHTLGCHHFHLLDASDRASGSNGLLIAKVTRDTFTVIMVTDHSVFDSDSEERARLQAIHDEIAFRGHPPGTVIIRAPIATSAHTVQAVHYAGECHRIIAEIEPQLDDPAFVNTLYPPGVETPAKSRMEWTFQHLDLGIYDKAKPAMLVLKTGWN
jgi:hypothetical protein